MADNSLPKVAETALPVAAMENVTHVRVVSTDNSERIPINNLTIAGTKVTVAVDGLSGTVDGAFGDVLTAIAEKADTTQVEALDAEKLDIANVYNGLDKAVEGFALDARQGKALNDVDKANYAKSVEMIAHDATAPSPVIPTGTTKTYEFSSGGVCEWLANQVVEKGDKVTVAFTAPSTFVRTYQDVVSMKVNTTDVEQVRSQATSKVPSSKLFDDELVRVETDLNVKIPIKISDNLFNKDGSDVLIGQYINSSGAIASGAYNASGFIEIQPLKTYYCSIESPRGFRFVCYYDANKNVIQSSTEDVRMFTTPTNCKYVRVTFYQSDYIYPQLSDSEIPYVPYNAVSGYIHDERLEILDINNRIGYYELAKTMGGYVNTNYNIGEVVPLTILANSSICCAVKNVEAGDVLILKGSGSSTARLWALLDVDNKLVNRSTTTGEENLKITIPSGVNIIIVNSFTANEPSFLYAKNNSIDVVIENNLISSQQYIDDALANSQDPILGGKKIVAVGDSYTHGDYTGEADVNAHKFSSGLYTGENKVWPFFIGRRTKSTIVNMAVNGGRMTTTPGWEVTNPSACFSYLLYQDIPVDADYIIMKYGINDENGISSADITLGTISSTNINDFYGAWNTVMTWIITNRPSAKIGIIISNDIINADVTNAVIAIAKKYGIAYLNEATDDTIPYFYRHFQRSKQYSGTNLVDASIAALRDDYYRMNATNSHPNDACQEYESKIIENFIRSL